jgi:aminoglycoside phosphotransferase
VTTTHDVRIDRDRGVVIKSFLSRGRGEPEREWSALTYLAQSAPGLAPVPLHADLRAGPATIEMSWLPGAPLAGAPLRSAQAQALATALERLWRPTPPAWPSLPGGVAPNSVTLASIVRGMLAAGPELGGDPVVGRAFARAAAWLDTGVLDRYHRLDDQAVLGQGDSNLANFLWDGRRIRVVDFEDSGPSNRAFELASLVEHVSAWSDASLDADVFLGLFDLTAAERAAALAFRRLAALFWLILLRPSGPASPRNPPGTLERQAHHLLDLFG